MKIKLEVRRTDEYQAAKIKTESMILSLNIPEADRELLLQTIRAEVREAEKGAFHHGVSIGSNKSMSCREIHFIAT